MTAPQNSTDDIRQAFGRYLPEVASRLLEFRKVARKPGKMTYIAVASSAGVHDPGGLLVGKRGVHVKAVSADLGGEFVNVVRWDDDAMEFIRNALRLSHRFRSELVCRFDPSSNQVWVTVDKKTNEFFSGLRLRLVSMLVGWDITLVQDESMDA
jgi:N utilization substance protein A